MTMAAARAGSPGAGVRGSGILGRRGSHPGLASRWAMGFLGLFIAGGIWQLSAQLAHSPVYPTASSAIADLGGFFSNGNLSSVIGVSLLRLVLGFVLSVVLGVGLGLFVGYSATANDYLAALIDFARSIPFPLILPLMIVIAGFGTRTVVLLIVLTSLWPLLVNTADAARSVDPLVYDVVKACKLPRAKAFGRVLFPAILPEILAGMRVAVGISLAALVIAEMIGASNGIGYYIVNAQSSFDSRATYAGVILLGGFGWIADTAFLALERRALRGRPTS